jgi:geranylgeranyl diphosphate synthase type II
MNEEVFTEFKNEMRIRKEHVDHVLADYFSEMSIPAGQGILELKKSMEYSLVRGGKRFRPTLCMLMADAFGIDESRVLPLACAIEMIHTYSLIHDDLPSMDNDDFRRGEATNHKVYGEATALLAGDGLLTEAFSLIAQSYSEEPLVAANLVLLVAKAAGIHGMVGGQSLDLKAQNQEVNQAEIETIHKMKTGALIRVCAEGSAVACGLSGEKVELAKRFGAELGLAFQLADDLLDSTEDFIEPNSLPKILGLAETKKYLLQVSERAHYTLNELGIQKGWLHQLVDYNSNRKN